MAAMAVPVLVWLATEVRRRPLLGIVLAGFVPVLLVAYMTSSRGALIAAALGSGAGDRGDAGAAAGRSRAPSSASSRRCPAIVVAAAAAGIVDSPGTAVGRPELEVCGALLVGFAIAVGRRPAGARPPRRGCDSAGSGCGIVLVASVALLAVLLVFVGPGRIAGDFAAKSGREAAPTGGDRHPAVGLGVGAGAVLGLGPRRVRDRLRSRGSAPAASRPIGTSTAASRRRSRMPTPSPWSCSRRSGRSAFSPSSPSSASLPEPESAGPADPTAHRRGRVSAFWRPASWACSSTGPGTSRR